jgi:hypothetical protein
MAIQVLQEVCYLVQLAGMNWVSTMQTFALIVKSSFCCFPFRWQRQPRIHVACNAQSNKWFRFMTTRLFWSTSACLQLEIDFLFIFSTGKHLGFMARKFDIIAPCQSPGKMKKDMATTAQRCTKKARQWLCSIGARHFPSCNFFSWLGSHSDPATTASLHPTAWGNHDDSAAVDFILLRHMSGICLVYAW